MLLNKRGAALFQVLIVTAILAGMSALILRLSLARTVTSRQTRHIINAQTVIESCMAEVNAIWAAKKPEAYSQDLSVCQMCDRTRDGDAACGIEQYKTHTCEVALDDDRTYIVEAKIEGPLSGTGNPPCKITYTIKNDNNNARETL